MLVSPGTRARTYGASSAHASSLSLAASSSSVAAAPVAEKHLLKKRHMLSTPQGLEPRSIDYFRPAAAVLAATPAAAASMASEAMVTPAELKYKRMRERDKAAMDALSRGMSGVHFDPMPTTQALSNFNHPEAGAPAAASAAPSRLSLAGTMSATRALSGGSSGGGGPEGTDVASMFSPLNSVRQMEVGAAAPVLFSASPLLGSGAPLATSSSLVSTPSSSRRSSLRNMGVRSGELAVSFGAANGNGNGIAGGSGPSSSRRSSAGAHLFPRTPPLMHCSPLGAGAGGMMMSFSGGGGGRSLGGQRTVVRRLGQPRRSEAESSGGSSTPNHHRRLASGISSSSSDALVAASSASTSSPLSRPSRRSAITSHRFRTSSTLLPDGDEEEDAVIAEPAQSQSTVDEDARGRRSRSSSVSSRASSVSDAATRGSPLLEAEEPERMSMSGSMSAVSKLHDRSRLHPTRTTAVAHLRGGGGGGASSSTTSSPFLDLTCRRRRDPNDMGLDDETAPGAAEGCRADAAAHLYRRTSNDALSPVDALIGDADADEHSPEAVLARLDRLKRLDAATDLGGRSVSAGNSGVISGGISNSNHHSRSPSHSYEQEHRVTTPFAGSLRVSTDMLLPPMGNGSVSCARRLPHASGSTAAAGAVGATGSGSTGNSSVGSSVASVGSPCSAELPATGLFTGLLKSARLSPMQAQGLNDMALSSSAAAAAAAAGAMATPLPPAALAAWPPQL
jgi:hypothetical protein